MNTNKTKTMTISNNKNRSCIDRHCFYFGPNQLESCTEYKYLGVIFKNKGKLKVGHHDKLKLYTGDNPPTWFNQ